MQGKTHAGNRAKPRRGQVFSCHLGVGVGSEFKKRRSCVVLSNNVNNVNNSIVIVAPITHTEKDLPICVPIADKHGADGSLVLNGCANLSGMRSVSSYRFAGLICELKNEEMDKIDAAIARQLDIMRHYSTLQSVIQDNKDHIERLNSVLERLCKILLLSLTLKNAILYLQKEPFTSGAVILTSQREEVTSGLPFQYRLVRGSKKNCRKYTYFESK